MYCNGVVVKGTEFITVMNEDSWVQKSCHSLVYYFLSDKIAFNFFILALQPLIFEGISVKRNWQKFRIIFLGIINILS